MIEVEGQQPDRRSPPGDNVRVNTTSYNRMVLLTGEVPKEGDKTTVEQVVARIDNVVSVVNELTVGPPNSFNEKTKAAYITTKVKASLVDAKDLFANQIKVVTHRGVVYLMGRVTEREATRAAEIARGVSGVVKVVKVFEILTEAEAREHRAKTRAPVAKPAAPPARPLRSARSAALRRRLIRLEVSSRRPPPACRSA